METRKNFGSRLGVVLAAAGSAVGLGNVWRFPTEVGNNGGAAFILIYLLCVLLIGVPVMISEFIIGRHAQSNAYRAYGKMGGRTWRFVGVLGILTSTIILGFYSVVAGWCLQYLLASVTGQLSGDSDYVKQYFLDMYSSPLTPCLWAVGFVLLTHLVVARGVQRGIERVSKILMPLLLVLLVACGFLSLHLAMVASAKEVEVVDLIRCSYHPVFRGVLVYLYAGHRQRHEACTLVLELCGEAVEECEVDAEQRAELFVKAHGGHVIHTVRNGVAVGGVGDKSEPIHVFHERAVC